ncbi:MAG TPA: pepsin/retropepsin-like aspartic protease family protein [Terriglobales bacterium]|jgi:predicted aspartyl protease|nr:pepsin/retropepsin-like aspartic protease family protein [Terriglobales bacterium]
MQRLVFLLAIFLSTSGQAQNEIRFRLIDNWAIVVEGAIAGTSHVSMLIDTGAVPSAIDGCLAKQMGLSGTRSEISVMNRTIGAERIRVSDVRVGPVSVAGLEMVAVDLSQISKALGTRIGAVIGLDLLGKQSFNLDYRHRRIAFRADSAGMDAVHFEVGEEASGKYIVIPVESEGQKLKVLLDTGTKDLMLFKNRVHGMVNALPTRAVSNLNAGGEDHLSEVELPSLSMGPLTRQKQKAYLWTFTEDRDRGFDGLLGPAALGVAIIRFDFERNVIEVGK